jgi:hypothetical protein
MLGAAGRPAARASFVEVPDRDDPRHASRVPQASFKLLLPGIDLHGSGATGQLAARASRRGLEGVCYGSGDFAWQTPAVRQCRVVAPIPDEIRPATRPTPLDGLHRQIPPHRARVGIADRSGMFTKATDEKACPSIARSMLRL